MRRVCGPYQCCGTSGRKAARLEGFAARTVLMCNGRRGGSGVHRRDRTAKGWSLARPVSRSAWTLRVPRSRSERARDASATSDPLLDEALAMAGEKQGKAVDPAAAGLSKREMNANANRIAGGDWASDAVRHAIDSMNAAVIAATSSTGRFGGGT